MTKRKRKFKASIPLEGLNIAKKEEVSIPLKALKIARKSLDKSKIGLAFESHKNFAKIPHEKRAFKLWLFWKGVVYPHNYIGSIAKASKRLGIPQDEMKAFVLERLKENLPLAIEKDDKPLIEFLEQKIKELKPREPFAKRICRTCGSEFEPRFVIQKNCKKCIDLWKSKRLRDMGLKPQ